MRVRALPHLVGSAPMAGTTSLVLDGLVFSDMHALRVVSLDVDVPGAGWP